MIDDLRLRDASNQRAGNAQLVEHQWHLDNLGVVVMMMVVVVMIMVVMVMKLMMMMMKGAKPGERQAQGQAGPRLPSWRAGEDRCSPAHHHNCHHHHHHHHNRYHHYHIIIFNLQSGGLK